MEIRAKIKATVGEINTLFDFDDIVSVRKFKLFKQGVYSTVLRIPDCDMSDIKTPMSIEDIKKKIVELCDECGNKILSATVNFKNGTNKIVYGGSEYWVDYNANVYAEKYNTEVNSICIKK